jgi:hypothetical protein
MRIPTLVLTLLALTSGAFAQGNQDVSFSYNVGPQDAPGLVTAGDKIKIRNDTLGDFIVIQVRDATEGMGGPAMGNPILILPGQFVEITIPNVPALEGFTFELDPDKYTPNGDGGFVLDPLNGT